MFDSLPLAWDKQLSIDSVGSWTRFTPARVGQTLRIIRFTILRTIHSHSRGIKWRPPCFPGTRHESFPRMWDKPCNALEVFSIFRLTPTHVEQTTQTFSWHRHDATHSHARGTDFLTSPVSPAWLDSFPLAWDRRRA